MAKKSYFELLKDPRWQRRRLEILSLNDFACENCRSGDRTLHVHHKLYRKGAMPWEYEDHELAALCENCHAAEHLIREDLAAMMALMVPSDLERLLGYAQGMMLFGGDIESVRIKSFEHALGLSDVAAAIPGQEVYEFIERSDGGVLSGRAISEAYSARRDSRAKR